jgi:2OG-Fe(II) oxygenase superfamily
MGGLFMTLAPRERLVAVLDREFGVPGFSATAEAEPGLLGLEVAGVGPVRFPVTPAAARKLCGIGVPARYGQGTQTLTDVSVRDTWEVPRDAVTIRWDGAFGSILDTLREDLGLAPSCSLRAEFHSMLVYEKGQFFLPHQDSEKDDAMVGTLVVTLPSKYTGGDLVIEKNGTKVECRGSASKLALAAFYADCRHEVRSVKTGNRITLTFNLLLDGAVQQPSAAAGAVGDVARQLREHFTTPVAVQYSRAPAVPPDRLVYLLDHEYTERSLSWDRLKGGDAARAGLLRAAADQGDCRVMLALTEIQEMWDAYPSNEGGGWDNHWRDEDDEEDGDEGADDDYELSDLIESSTRLVRWTDPDTGKTEKITLDVDDTELCAGTANDMLTPYEQEYEGYMGNYGNTLDRWYRRAALVLFPADREFANRAEASPDWAMTQIGKRARSGDLVGARTDAADLAPFWAASVGQNPQPGSLEKTLRTAYVLDDAATASLLLAPFRAENLTAPVAVPLARLAQRYGAEWTGELLRGWFGDGRRHYLGYGGEHLTWYSSLPELCTALHTAGDSADAAARTLADLSWQRLLTEAGALSVQSAPSRREAGLAGLGQPLAAVLAAAECCQMSDVRGEIVCRLGELGDEATAWLLSALRAATALPDEARPNGTLPDKGVPGGGFEAVAADCGGRLRKRLARPVRAAADWSIIAPDDCACALCEVLTSFLTNPKRRVHEWPLKEQSRRHVHSRIDQFELPVSHDTRRQGRPYTLMLAKQEKLFAGERAARARDEADLLWLESVWPSAAERQ